MADSAQNEAEKKAGFSLLPRGFGVKVGILLGLSIIVAAAFIVYVLFARGVFENTQSLDLITDNAEGVSVGSDLSFAGFPIPLPKVNLVGNNCQTVAPVNVTMSGIAHLGAPSTFKGTFSIPEFTGCQGFENALNQLIPGPGNTFTATARPPA